MAGSADIVIVDDEAELRAMVAEYLSRHGFVVRTAAGGGELDALLAARPADLLILDVNMPDEDGLAIARRISCCSDRMARMVLTRNAVAIPARINVRISTTSIAIRIVSVCINRYPQH